MRFRKKTLETINAANAAIKSCRSLGKPTLMELYQLMVVDGTIEEGRASYKRLQGVISQACKHGLFDRSNIAGRYHGIGGV